MQGQESICEYCLKRKNNSQGNCGPQTGKLRYFAFFPANSVESLQEVYKVIEEVEVPADVLQVKYHPQREPKNKAILFEPCAQETSLLKQTSASLEKTAAKELFEIPEEDFEKHIAKASPGQPETADHEFHVGVPYGFCWYVPKVPEIWAPFVVCRPYTLHCGFTNLIERLCPVLGLGYCLRYTIYNLISLPNWNLQNEVDFWNLFQQQLIRRAIMIYRQRGEKTRLQPLSFQETETVLLEALGGADGGSQIQSASSATNTSTRPRSTRRRMASRKRKQEPSPVSTEKTPSDKKKMEIVYSLGKPARDQENPIVASLHTFVPNYVPEQFSDPLEFLDSKIMQSLYTKINTFEAEKKTFACLSHLKGFLLLTVNLRSITLKSSDDTSSDLKEINRFAKSIITNKLPEITQVTASFLQTWKATFLPHRLVLKIEPPVETTSLIKISGLELAEIPFFLKFATPRNIKVMVKKITVRLQEGIASVKGLVQGLPLEYFVSSIAGMVTSKIQFTAIKNKGLQFSMQLALVPLFRYNEPPRDPNKTPKKDPYKDEKSLFNLVSDIVAKALAKLKSKPTRFFDFGTLGWELGNTPN